VREAAQVYLKSPKGVSLGDEPQECIWLLTGDKWLDDGSQSAVKQLR
jgi:hypothetical protein